MHAWRGHDMAGDVRCSGGQWRATGGAPAGGLAPPGAVHLPRPSWGSSRCHSERPMVAPAPRRACPTGVRRVRRLADVAALDVAVERAPAFPANFNSLIQFSNTCFSEFETKPCLPLNSKVVDQVSLFHNCKG
jgi:hypothetical protein